MSWWKIPKEAFDIFMNVRETIAFYMFIIEESIQAVGMACYLLKKYGLDEDAKQYANWAKSNLIQPLREFAQGVGQVAYPMNQAYIAFADATEKVMDAYLKTPAQPPQQK